MKRNVSNKVHKNLYYFRDYKYEPKLSTITSNLAGPRPRLVQYVVETVKSNEISQRYNSEKDERPCNVRYATRCLCVGAEDDNIKNYAKTTEMIERMTNQNWR